MGSVLFTFSWESCCVYPSTANTNVGVIEPDPVHCGTIMKPEIGQLIIDTSLNPGYEIRPHGIQTIQLSCYFQTLEMVIQPSFFLILQIYHGNSHSFSFGSVGPWKSLLLWLSIYCYFKGRGFTQR